VVQLRIRPVPEVKSRTGGADPYKVPAAFIPGSVKPTLPMSVVENG